MRVRDIMTKHVLMIPAETSIEDAARIMRDETLGCSLSAIDKMSQE
jgi:CBS domain-containing protein